MAAGDLRLRAAGAQQQEIGKGIVRLGLKQIRSLGVNRGDVIEIKGKKSHCSNRGAGLSGR